MSPRATRTFPTSREAAAGRPPSHKLIAMSAGCASRADGRKRLAGSGAADGVPEGGAAAPHRRHHGANDMDPQTIERAINRYIDISSRLGALEDEAPRVRPRHCPVRGRHRRNAAMARKPRVNSPAAGPEAASPVEPHPSPRCVHKTAGGGTRRPRPAQTVRAHRSVAPRPPRPPLLTCRVINGRNLASGHGQPLRRRRRRVTRQGRSASEGPAKRVDSVTAVA